MVGIGYALVVLFFAISLCKNTMNFHELKRPEAAIHYFLRFVAAKALVGYGMDIMLNVFSICNGIVTDMADSMGGISEAMVSLPAEMQTAIENVGFLASIPLWLVTILGSLFITVLSFVMILTVYGRFFRLYMYTALAPLPLAAFAGESTQSVGMDEKAFARDVLYHRENDGFDALRAERNRQIKANARENGNVVQHKYIIVSTNKPGVKEARERFVQVQGHLLSAFSALECAVTPLDNRARLEVLHKFFRISEEGRFNFDFDNCAKLGQDFRDSIQLSLISILYK